ncbi:phage head-tail connector protein, partial [Clostridioides difficile]|uniref:phage head-tail connector protein n=1 Tax=Clostridioides difficile TaxID=1496 RepID=UPI001CA4A3AD
MEVERLKKLLGISKEDYSKEMILEFILEDVEEIVKNYCNVSVIPEGLNSTVLRMAIDMYKNENLGSEDIALGSISSISEGDTKVDFAIGSGSQTPEQRFDSLIAYLTTYGDRK